jgi:hypothetical protein
LITSPSGATIWGGTSATSSSEDWCRAVTRNHSLFRLIGPPNDAENM